LWLNMEARSEGGEALVGAKHHKVRQANEFLSLEFGPM